MSTRIKKNRLALVSLAFVAVMLTLSAGLYRTETPEVEVETLRIETGPGYSLDTEVDQNDGVPIPISHNDVEVIDGPQSSPSKWITHLGSRGQPVGWPGDTG
jgi:hypothetical protein